MEEDYVVLDSLSHTKKNFPKKMLNNVPPSLEAYLKIKDNNIFFCIEKNQFLIRVSENFLFFLKPNCRTRSWTINSLEKQIFIHYCMQGEMNSAKHDLVQIVPDRGGFDAVGIKNDSALFFFHISRY